MTEKEQKKIKKERDSFYEKLDECTRIISNPESIYKTITFICKGFPDELFKQWKVQCEEEFNDIYWAKIWNDHIKSQAYDAIICGGIKYLKEVNSTSEPAKQEKKEEVIHVFGDGYTGER